MRYEADQTKDQKIFRTTAKKTNKLMQTRRVPRGGYRL